MSTTLKSTLVKNIIQIIENGKNRAYQSVNLILFQTYWTIGKNIVEYEQMGKIKAQYGKVLLLNLSRELRQYGHGFSRSNLQYMRLLYLYFLQIPDTSGKLKQTLN